MNSISSEPVDPQTFLLLGLRFRGGVKFQHLVDPPIGHSVVAKKYFPELASTLLGKGGALVFLSNRGMRDSRSASASVLSIEAKQC